MLPGRPPGNGGADPSGAPARQGARDPSGAPARIQGVATRPTTIARRRQLFREAVEIIEREYASDLELGGVAHRIATSRRQLQRAFAEVGGTSFRDHLAAVRMRHAVELLSGGRAQVRDIALTVGYRQPAQFAKAFRRHLGAAPSAFRRRGAPAVGAGEAAHAGGDPRKEGADRRPLAA